jgi:hypothetical protein
MVTNSASDPSADPAGNPINGLQGLPVGNEDDYEVHEDEYVTPEEIDSDTSGDSDTLEDLENAFRYRVDLATQDSQHERKPIYTRTMLERVKRLADQVRMELSLAPNQRTLHHIDADGLNKKKYKVWDSSRHFNANSLIVEYLSRVEMHRDFQDRYGEHSDQIQALRKYNERHKTDCIDTPYTFTTFNRKFLNEHSIAAKMRRYWNAIQNTRRLWMQSSSREMLRETFRDTATKCAPITQVVCFGVGAINLDMKFYQSAIQYMAVFSIIQILNEYYRTTDSDRPSIKLLLQDPNYELKDHHLLKKMFGNDHDISFVSDPDGLLAIDAGTLIVTAFLPVQVPLVQIIADMFSEDPTRGPAAMLCDVMTVDVEKREYSLIERASPAVARHLTTHYEKKTDGFQDHGLEDELMADSYGQDWVEKNSVYWLNKMDLWVRKSSVDREQPVEDQ